MSERDEPTLDDILPADEQAVPDHHEHGKTPMHLNGDDLAHRTEQERIEVGLEDYDPDEVPPADS